jgi:hypothetical protein
MIVHFIGYETQRVTLNLTGGELVVPTVKLASSTFGLAEATVMAGAVQGRATPVAVSTLNVEYIERNLGDKELVEVLNVTDWGRYRSATDTPTATSSTLGATTAALPKISATTAWLSPQSGPAETWPIPLKHGHLAIRHAYSARTRRLQMEHELGQPRRRNVHQQGQQLPQAPDQHF